MIITLSHPVPYKDAQISEIDIDLDALTGQDIIDAENSMRALGQTVNVYSQSYFAAIAAKAAHIPIEIITSLCAKDFMKLTNNVLLFFADMDSGDSLLTNSEK